MTATINSGPGQLNWVVYAGDLNEETFQFLADDDPWDLTGATITAQARVTPGDVAVALEAVCEISGAGPGLATVSWDGEDVRALLAGADSWTGVWDLQVLEAGETLPRTVLRGKMMAQMDVTRAVTV